MMWFTPARTMKSDVATTDRANTTQDSTVLCLEASSTLLICIAAVLSLLLPQLLLYWCEYLKGRK